MDRLTKFLAVTGAILVWGVILLTILNAVAVYVIKHNFNIQYLIPPGRLSQIYLLTPLWAFWVASAGGGLTLWAALRERRETIASVIGISMVILTAAQALVAGLFPGGTDPVSWNGLLAQAAPGVYLIALLTIGICAALAGQRVSDKATR